jgi:hypothetical protein
VAEQVVVEMVHWKAVVVQLQAAQTLVVGEVALQHRMVVE